jgi:glucokinase
MEYAIGIDLGGTNLRLARVDREGRISSRRQVKTAQFHSSPELIDGISREARALIREAESTGDRVLGAGIGVPGGVNPAGEIVYFLTNFPSGRDLPLRRLLEEKIERRIRMGNDANIWAYGESWLGAGRGRKNLVLITLGTGVGGGIIIDEKIYVGHSGIAGEIGHITIEPEGSPCGCGGRGCLETIAAAGGFIRLAREQLDRGKPSLLSQSEEFQPLSALNVFRAAQKGDQVASEVLNRVGHALGIGISILINVLNPEIIILGGGVAGARELFTPPMVEEIKLRAFSRKGKETPVVPPQLREDAGILGAARLIFNAE